MIDPKKCEVSIQLMEGKKSILAKVSFFQDGCRLSYFRLREGEFGIWLEPPKINAGYKWVGDYYDEDLDRYKELQGIAVKEYFAHKSHNTPSRPRKKK